MMLDDSGATIVVTDSIRAASGLFAGRTIELAEALTPDEPITVPVTSDDEPH